MGLINSLKRLFKRKSYLSMKTFLCPVCHEQARIVYMDEFFNGQERKSGSLVQCQHEHYSVHVEGWDIIVIPSDYSNLHLAFEQAVCIADFGRKWDAWQDSIYDSEPEIVHSI